MNPPTIPDVPSDTVKRITAAADALYDECGKNSFPNVDAVRRKARVNMNDASIVMRAWRQTQTTAAASPPSSIPSAVQDATEAMLATVWNAATTAADISLRTAQAGWELERAEAEACRLQLAIAFDSQTEELAIAQRNNLAIEQKLVAEGTELQAVSSSLEKIRLRLSDAESRATTSEIRSAEIAKRADELRAELDRAHESANQDRLDAKRRLDSADLTITRLREELQTTLERESGTRAELAYLRGQLEAKAADSDPLIPTSPESGKGRRGNAASSAAAASSNGPRS